MQTAKQITLVTVVPAEELGLVSLQARSIARFFPIDLVGKIILIVNDCDEASTKVALQSYRVSYGPHESKVEIVGASDMFALHSGSFRFSQRIRKRLVTAPWLRAFRGSTGWQKHDGWSIQQALKLLSAKLIETDFTVLLDCKNIFTNDVSFNDFVDDVHRAKLEISILDRNHRRWLPASLRLMGGKVLLSEVECATQYVTPFCIRTTLLKNVVAQVEDTHGELISIFAIRFLNVMFWNVFNYTEFMLVTAYIYSKGETLDTHFAHEKRRSPGLHASSSDTEFSDFFTALNKPDTFSVALHGVYLARASDETLKMLTHALMENGLQIDANELQDIANKIARVRASRVKYARKRVKSHASSMSEKL